MSQWSKLKMDKGVNDHCWQTETRWDKLSMQLVCSWPATHTPPCSINLAMTLSSFEQQVKILIPIFANLQQYAHSLTCTSLWIVAFSFYFNLMFWCFGLLNFHLYLDMQFPWLNFFISKQDTKITLNYITRIKHDRNVKLKMNNINLSFTSKDQLEIWIM